MQLLRSLRVLSGLKNCSAHINLVVNIHYWHVFIRPGSSLETWPAAEPSKRWRKEVAAHNREFHNILKQIFPLLAQLTAKGMTVTLVDNASAWKHAFTNDSAEKADSVLNGRREHRLVSTKSPLQKGAANREQRVWRHEKYCYLNPHEMAEIVLM